MPRSRFATGLFVALVALLSLGVGTAVADPDPNDSFAFATNANVVSGQNNGDRFFSGSNVEATKEAGEPEVQSLPAWDRSIWFHYTPQVTGNASFDTCDTLARGTTVSLFTGTAVNALTRVPGTTDALNTGCGGPNGAKLTAAVVFGTKYYFRVTNTSSAAGSSVFARIRTAPYIKTAPVVSGTPAENSLLTSNGGVWDGGTKSDGSAQTKSFSWLRCTNNTSEGSCTPITGGQTFATYSPFGDDVGKYLRSKVTSSNDLGDATSVSAAVGPVTGTPPLNDNLANATGLPTAKTVVESATNAAATRETGEPDPWSAGNLDTVWFRWTAPASGVATIGTCLTEQPFDAVLAIYTANGAGFGNLNQVGKDDEGCGSSATGMPTKRIPVTAGTLYFIQVGRYNVNASSGPFKLTIELGPANDDFASATDLGSSAGVTADSTTFQATRESGEPSPIGSANINTIWFSWTAPVSGSAVFDTCSSPLGSTGQPGHDGVMAVWTGTALGDLSKLDSDDDGCGDGGSMPKMTLSVVAGTKYWVQLAKFGPSDAFGIAGPITLKIGTRPVNVTPPLVTGKLSVGQTLTAAQGVWAGLEPIDFSATGLWFRCAATTGDCDPIAGAINSSYTLTADDLGKFLLYSEFPSNSLGNALAAADSGRIGPIAAPPPPVIVTPPAIVTPPVHPVTIAVPTAKASKLKVKAKKGKFTLPKTKVACASSATGACTGTATLTVKTKKKTIKFKIIKLTFAKNTTGAVKMVVARDDAATFNALKKSVATVKLSISAPGFAAKTATVKFTLSG